MSAPLPLTFRTIVSGAVYGLILFTAIAALFVAAYIGWRSGVDSPYATTRAEQLVTAGGWGATVLVFAPMFTFSGGLMATVIAGAPLVALFEFALREVRHWLTHAIAAGVAGAVAGSILIAVLGGELSFTLLSTDISFWPVLSVGLVLIAAASASAGWIITWRLNWRSTANSSYPAPTQPAPPVPYALR